MIFNMRGKRYVFESVTLIRPERFIFNQCALGLTGESRTAKNLGGIHSIAHQCEIVLIHCLL